MKRALTWFFKKVAFVLHVCLAISTPLQQAEVFTSSTVTYHDDLLSPSSHNQAFITLSENELKKIIVDFYTQADTQGFSKQLPEKFLICHALVRDGIVTVTRDELLESLFLVITWLADELQTKKSRSTRIENEYEPKAPRPDAPTPEDSIFPVGPGGCCDNSEILRLLGTIRSRIGSVDECSCEETILSILGDACAILGPCETISSGIKDILECCEDTFTLLATLTAADLSPIFTVLNVLTTNECSPILIRQSDVGITTFTISQPGRYIFAEDISFAPASPQPAIAITSSGVTLDLLCHKLAQTNSTSGVDGIQVSSSLSDVTIIHGSVQNFTRAGITVNSASSRITIDGVTIFSCNVRGIELLGTSGEGNQITESEISNCKLVFCCRGASGDIVLTLSQCTDVRVSNCRINQNGTINHVLQAVRLDNALKCELKDIEANDNFASTDFRGYDLSQSTYCVLKNCITKNNQATAAASNNRGFILESSTSCTANEFLDCTALNLSGTAAVDGFLTDTGCNDNLFIRCEASFNSSHGAASTAIVHGFNIISNSRNIFIDCIARNNSAPNSTATPAPAFGAKGFDLNTCIGCNLLRCLATDQSTGASSTSVGVHVNQGSQCSIRDCQSSRHSVGFRLDPNNSTAHVFSRNFAGKNTTQYSQFPGGSTDNAGTIANINAQLNNPWTNVSVG